MAKLDWEKSNQYDLIKKRNGTTRMLNSMDSKLTFGKHVGKPLKWVYDNDYKYYRWMVNNEVIELKGDTLPKKNDAAIRCRMDKRYCTISLGRNHVNHVYNHETNKVVCGCDRYAFPPVVMQRAVLSKEDIVKKHIQQAERRGGSNPFKFVCQGCMRGLDKNYEKTKEKVYKDRKENVKLAAILKEWDEKKR